MINKCYLRKLFAPALLVALMFTLTACEDLQKIAQSSPLSIPLTEKEVVEGLKEALITGATNSSKILSKENGYFSDLAVKILLPPEANIIIENISKIPGGAQLVEDVILRINRAAEEAAKELVPVFSSSIKQMTIQDGFGILRGADNAATDYLKRTTYDALYRLYKPKLESATTKKIVGNISTMDSWTTLTQTWNTFANSAAGRLANVAPVNTDLNDFLTKKALDGAFLKVEAEEYKIRKNANARITPLLERVFGSLNNNSSNTNTNNTPEPNTNTRTPRTR